MKNPSTKKSLLRLIIALSLPIALLVGSVYWHYLHTVTPTEMPTEVTNSD